MEFDFTAIRRRCREQHFGRAAEASASLSRLVRQIQDLERDGIFLLDRLPRGFDWSRAGKLFFEAIARRIFKTLMRRNDAAERIALAAGTLRIGIATAVSGMDWL